MDEYEHEVYGAEIPDVTEMEGDMDSLNADVEMARIDVDALKELGVMKKRLKDMEEDAAALREMQAKVEREMGVAQAEEEEFGEEEGSEQEEQFATVSDPPFATVPRFVWFLLHAAIRLLQNLDIAEGNKADILLDL